MPHPFKDGGAIAVAFALLLTVTAQAQTTAPSADPDPLLVLRLQQDVFRQAAARIAPCVVTIETIGGTQPQAPAPPAPGPIPIPGQPQRPGGRPRGPRPGADPGPGFIIAEGPTTGLIWSADGLILTSAFNFVREPSVITVILPDGRRFVGKLLARDEVRRLAMLKIDATGLPVPKWVPSLADIRVGQWALALGRGFGGDQPSVSAGIVSGLNRKGGVAVQTDAKLSPANFGGPLVDLEGRVIGLNVPMGMTNSAMAGVEWYDSGIGFAVPFAQVGKSAEALALGHNLRRGIMGVQLDPRGKSGVRIVNIAEPSPASRAGLAVGDVIVALDKQPARDYNELQRLMSARLAGEKLLVRVKRNQEELEVTVLLGVPEDMGDLPPPPPEPADTQPADTEPGDTEPPDSQPGDD